MVLKKIQIVKSIDFSGVDLQSAITSYGGLIMISV